MKRLISNIINVSLQPDLHKMKYSFFSLIIICNLLLSCSLFEKPQESELNYLQNIEQLAGEVALKGSEVKLKADDQLIIFVSAKDMDVARPFNQNYSSSETIQNAPSGGNTPNSSISTISGPSYIVDSEGYVDFPVVGKILAAGKTQEQFRDELRGKISRYIINPSVSLRLVNFKVTVLGEVNRPGEYTVPNGKATILNAIGLAGDLTQYGKRDDVLVLRNQDAIVHRERINLKDANFLNSEFYNLRQGDVIVISANENKEISARTNPNTGLIISAASVGIGVLALVISLLRK